MQKIFFSKHSFKNTYTQLLWTFFLTSPFFPLYIYVSSQVKNEVSPRSMMSVVRLYSLDTLLNMKIFLTLKYHLELRT